MNGHHRPGPGPSRMPMEINALAKTVLAASTRGFLRRKPIFNKYKTIQPGELMTLAEEIEIPIPESLRDWLLAVGYGDINDEISFRKEWFSPVKGGQLKGGAIFAQDILGDFYAFDLQGRIYRLSRSEPVYAILADNFAEFMAELVLRKYKLLDWVAAVEPRKYDWQGESP